MIPEADRARYGHMSERDYYEMLLGEDPDDRAIREAHGISYGEPCTDQVMCRNGCGLDYADISSGKIRVCTAAGFTCPRCGATSHHPTDLAEGYCGRCHDWTGQRR